MPPHLTPKLLHCIGCYYTLPTYVKVFWCNQSLLTSHRCLENSKVIDMLSTPQKMNTFLQVPRLVGDRRGNEKKMDE